MQAIGIVVALPAEARSLARIRPGFDSVSELSGGHWLGLAGAGPERAHAIAHRLAEKKIGALISWGSAAALADHLRPGHLVLPDQIMDEQGSIHPVDRAWRNQLQESLSPELTTWRGTLLGSSRVIGQGHEKRSLHAKTGGIALDMESHAVARFARDRELPFLAVRAIADPADFDFPAAVSRSLNPRGDVRLLTLLGHLARQPRQLGDLISLGRAFNAALGTLTRVRRAAGDDFSLPGFGPRLPERFQDE